MNKQRSRRGGVEDDEQERSSSGRDRSGRRIE